MKTLLTYKLFESEKIKLSDYELDAKNNLEFILEDVKESDSNFEISTRNKFMLTLHDDWYRNTGVERGFTDYLCVRVTPNWNYIEDVISTLKECLSLMTQEPADSDKKWKYNVKIDRGVSIININIDDIVSLYRHIIEEFGKNYLGTIHIYFWR